jgi:MFS superfamily sulfate permease-like transporter
MPTDVKAAVSAVVILVAIGLVVWSGSPIRPAFDKFVLFTALFFVVAMWIFPEAGGKKSGVKKK